MKKSSLTTAVLAGLAGVVGFAGSSNAVELNPDGTGQALIYPYYTVRAGQQTYISVVNSTDTTQSVKVRFLEGYASKEVLDFNVFLSPYDVWTGTVFKVSDVGLSGDGAAIGTTDNSCTIPNFAALPTVPGSTSLHYQPFTNLYYTNPSYDPDEGPSGLDRTNEGYVELIAMGEVTGAAADAVEHVQQSDENGLTVPGKGKPKCASFSLDDDSAPELNTLPPPGGLFGSGAVVNVGEGTFYTYNADAISGFTVTNLFTKSSALSPSLASANSGLAGATANVFDGGAVVSANFTRGADAVSAVFDSSAIMNEWLTGGGASVGTDWVVTFPTKRFYVNYQYVGAGPALDPFAEVVDENFDGASCVAVGLNIFDREEGFPGTIEQGPIFSPAPIIHTDVPSLCHEVNVISIAGGDDPASILGSEYENSDGGMGLALNVQPFGTSGWLKIDFVNNAGGEAHELTSDDGVTFNGLPVTGFQAVRYINGNAQPGKLSNYSGAFRHRAERDITQS